jgi:hypothetical protein
MRRLIFVLLVSLVVIAGTGGATAAARGTPVRGTFDVALTNDFADPGCRAAGGFVRQFASGGLRATQVGRGTLEWDVCVGSGDGRGLSVFGTVTIVAANGDRMTLSADGFSGVGTSGLLEADLELTVVGGTGRFAAATGTLRLTGTSTGVPPSMSTGTIDGRVHRR